MIFPGSKRSTCRATAAPNQGLTNWYCQLVKPWSDTHSSSWNDAFTEVRFVPTVWNNAYNTILRSNIVVARKTAPFLVEVQYKKGGTETGSPWNKDFAPSKKEVSLAGDKSGFKAPTPSISNAYEGGDPLKAISMSDKYV